MDSSIVARMRWLRLALGTYRAQCGFRDVGDVLVNVPWQRRMARKNASLGVNERRWMLLCRVIHPLGVQLLRVMSLVSSALLDYAWVIFGQQSLWCLIQRCYWNLHVRGTLWQQDLQAPKPSMKKSPYQVQKNLPSTDRTLRDMCCRADHQGVVRVWQRSTQSGSPWVGDLLLVVDSVAKVGFSSKIVQGVRLALDGQPSLLQTGVAFASVLSRNRSDALKGVMALIGEAQSVDEEVLAEFTGLHLRRRDDQVVSKAAARVPGELTSRVRAALAAAAAQSGFLSVSLGHLRLLPSLDKGHSCPLSSSTVVKILGLAVEEEILSRAATELARQQETVVSKHVQVQKNLPSTDRTLRDMCCRADHQGVVRVWQRSTQSGSPWVGDLLLVVDSVAKVGFSSKIVQGVRLALDGQPSLLQTGVAFASVLSRNRSDAEELKGVMVLIGEAQSVDEEVLAEITGLHLRRRDDLAVVKGSTSSRRIDIQDARGTRRGCRSMWVFVRITRSLASVAVSWQGTLVSAVQLYGGEDLGARSGNGNSFPCCDRTRPPAGNP